MHGAVAVADGANAVRLHQRARSVTENDQGRRTHREEVVDARHREPAVPYIGLAPDSLVGVGALAQLQAADVSGRNTRGAKQSHQQPLLALGAALPLSEGQQRVLPGRGHSGDLMAHEGVESSNPRRHVRRRRKTKPFEEIDHLRSAGGKVRCRLAVLSADRLGWSRNLAAGKGGAHSVDLDPEVVDDLVDVLEPPGPYADPGLLGAADREVQPIRGGALVEDRLAIGGCGKKRPDASPPTFAADLDAKLHLPGADALRRRQRELVDQGLGEKHRHPDCDQDGPRTGYGPAHPDLRVTRDALRLRADRW